MRHPSPAARPAALALAALLALPLPSAATYSIVARDPETGQLGAAVQSHWFAVHSVLWVEPGVGAIATQSFADFTYGPAGLELLRLGRPAQATLDGLIAADSGEAVRQVAILDADGDIAVHTGSGCIAFASHVAGANFSAQANLMRNEGVPEAMAAAFESTKGPLAERLLAALDAAQAAGGDIRGRQSAALVVVAPEPTGRPWADRLVDLRIDDAPDPLVELRRHLGLVRAYEAMDAGDVAVAEGDFERARTEYGRAAKLAPDNPEVLFWNAIWLANEGKGEDAVDEAVELLARVYALDPAWRDLPARLVAAGLLPDDVALLARLVAAGRP